MYVYPVMEYNISLGTIKMKLKKLLDGATGIWNVKSSTFLLNSRLEFSAVETNRTNSILIKSREEQQNFKFRALLNHHLFESTLFI